jgi:hypothetical protein
MLSLEQLRWRLAEKGYRHRHLERLLREDEGAAVPPEVLDQVERFLTADGDRIFRLWFGERDYKKHFNLAIVECAQGGIGSILDYVRREG